MNLSIGRWVRKRLPRSNSYAKSERSEADLVGDPRPSAPLSRAVEVNSNSTNYHQDRRVSSATSTISTAQRTASQPTSRAYSTASERTSSPLDETGAPDSAAPVQIPVISATDFTTEAGHSLEKNVQVQEFELSAPSSAQPSLLRPPSAGLEAQESPLSASPAVSPVLTPALQFPFDDVHEIMQQRKIWVRRPGASATLVSVLDDDLVDTVRDSILQKYANSLGRSIDSPDITLKILANDQGNKTERVLGPEENIGRTLDQHYPRGQTIDEALIIDVPQRRTPKPSPRVGNHHAIAYPYYVEDHRPGEGAREYFPPMAVHSPHLGAHPAHPTLQNSSDMRHSMAVLTSGQIPPIPSPGGYSSRKHGRPKYMRQHTSSPTILHSTQPHSNDLKQPIPNGVAPPAPLPTPPAQNDHRPSITPPNRTSSPLPGRSTRKKKQGPSGQSQATSTKTINGEPPPPPKLQQAGLLDGNVPPINVLIVEDNPINLRLLEQFMRRLKVRWKTAMNGREAVNTWKTGGFHLVLMDIQLPVMNGLEATKEIRRLESVNGIGLGLVGGQNTKRSMKGEHEINPEDKLQDMGLFKSPVIIVALTASSLQSDRHEALAVGCNDFLTKPVTLPWMLRKVTEWGCMQALIDFDGWRQWKASAEKKDEGLSEEQKKVKEKEEKAKQKAALKAMFAKPPPSTKDKKEETKTETAQREPVLKSSVNGTAASTAPPGLAAPGRAQRIMRGSSGSGLPLETTHEEENEE